VARARFDREAAFRLLRRFAETGSKDDQDRAYEAIDESVSIAARLVFSRCPSNFLLDDLKQAARLRLYTTLPRMTELCDSPEFYFRVLISLCKRAMLTEYAHLRRQGQYEVPEAFLYSPEGEEDSHEMEDFPDPSLGTANNWVVFPIDPNLELAERETRLLADQVANQVYVRAKRWLLAVISDSNEQQAAVFALVSVLDGRVASPAWLSQAFGFSPPVKPDLWGGDFGGMPRIYTTVHAAIYQQRDYDISA
jgi:DNA-directed RNA polymerase specialized sigma24 family protein